MISVKTNVYSTGEGHWPQGQPTLQRWPEQCSQRKRLTRGFNEPQDTLHSVGLARKNPQNPPQQPHREPTWWCCSSEWTFLRPRRIAAVWMLSKRDVFSPLSGWSLPVHLDRWVGGYSPTRSLISTVRSTFLIKSNNCIKDCYASPHSMFSNRAYHAAVR
jgi:hypothetical protein